MLLFYFLLLINFILDGILLFVVIWVKIFLIRLVLGEEFNIIFLVNIFLDKFVFIVLKVLIIFFFVFLYLLVLKYLLILCIIIYNILNVMCKICKC